MSPWARRSVCALLMVWLSCIARRGQASDGDESAWKRSCDRVKNVPFPASDQPDEATRKALRGCESEGLFYGIGQRPDPAKARACAYVELAAGDDAVFGGSTILMTIYATGVGAAQNLDLALRLACGVEGAPAEMEGRVAHLEGLKAANKGRVKFDVCDDITSGFMMGHCAAHRQRMVSAKRDQRYAARLAKWTAPERAEFQKLRTAASEFFHARSSNEVDLSGTARGAMQIDEEEELEGAFARLLDDLDRDRLPKATAADLAAADHDLNATYRRVMTTASLKWGSVTKEGVRATERTWPKFRDAWAAFAVVKYPQIDPVSVKVRVTRERTADLQGLDGADDAK
jgi:uncharacterized protein YecT (DUF1311 family)